MIPSSVRASVVLPLPDSPTSPSVSPGQMAALTPTSAWISAPCCLKVLPRSSNCSSGLAPCGRPPAGRGRPTPRAGGPAPARGRSSGRCGAAPSSSSVGSSVRQRSSASAQRSANTQPAIAAPRLGRKPGIVSRRPWSLRTPPRGMQRRRPTVYGMTRILEHRLDGPLFDEPPGVEHADAVAHLRDHAEVVADEEHGGVQLRLEVRDEVEHLGLDGRVEAGRRLVEDQQRRVLRERHRDHDALLHAARELVRVAAHDRARDRRSAP